MKFIYSLSWLFIFLLFFPISLIVFIREFGRLLSANLFKVKVFKFVFGFGREIFCLNLFDIRFIFHLFPLGSYLEMDSPPEVCFHNNSFWKKSLISLSGSLTLFICVLVLSFSSLYFFKQLDVSKKPVKPVVGGLSFGMPAEKAGFKIGDKIISINGQPITEWSMILDSVNKSNGKSLLIQYQRNDLIESLEILPLYLEDANKYIIGIMPHNEEISLNFIQAFNKSFEMISVRLHPYLNIFNKKIEPIIIINDSSSISPQSDSFVNVLKFNILWFLDSTLLLLILSLIPIPFFFDFGNFLYYLFESLKLTPSKFDFSYYANRLGLFTLPILLIVFTLIEIFI